MMEEEHQIGVVHGMIEKEMIEGFQGSNKRDERHKSDSCFREVTVYDRYKQCSIFYFIFIYIFWDKNHTSIILYFHL